MSATDSTGNSTAAAAASASSSRSNSKADSYIGSLISLTSKSEIRYEGVLYNINTDTSSIGLKNVRSFGTEGRKKDGPQILPSDKVYEYILFRGTDIKDLQVKSSPPVQPSPTINNDPAIIQSHYSRPVSTSASSPSSVGGSFTDINSQNAQMGLPGSSFQGGIPLYQPGGGLGTWGASPPPPNANGSGLAMPMYWQGYYSSPNGLPHMQQQSLVRPPPGMPMPPSVQQPMQYPNFNAPLPSGASNFPASNLPTNFSISNLPTNVPTSNLPASLPEVPSPLMTSTTSPVGSSSIPSPPASLPSNLPILPSATLASETLPTLMPNKAPSSALPATSLSANLLPLSPLSTSSPELNAIPPAISNKPKAISDPLKGYLSGTHSSSSVVAPNSLQTETPTPSLITPGQLLRSGPSTTTSQPVQIAHKDVEVVQVSSSSSPQESAVPVTTEAQPPILPLPAPSQASYKPNGANFRNYHVRGGYRGRDRGRGSGSSRPVTKFTEDFDFTAMNEKFNKDEVWGHLGKSNKSHLKDSEDGRLSDEDSQDEDEESLKTDIKAVYNKDDFFDTLSCNATDIESRNGRTRFSEQLKIDTETFGEFSRYRGGRGGRGPPRGGRSRGSYYGRGYGYSYNYVGRGRGRTVPRNTP